MKLQRANNGYFYKISECSNIELEHLINKFTWRTEDSITIDMSPDTYIDIGDVLKIDEPMPSNCISRHREVSNIYTKNNIKKVTCTDCLTLTLIHKRSDGFYYVPWGLLSDSELQYEVDIEDNIHALPLVTKDINDGIELFEFQIKAIQKSIMLRRGLISVSTGGGKTEIIAGIVKYCLSHNVFEKIIIVTPNVTNCEQLYDRLVLRGVPTENMGLYHGGERDNSKTVTVGVINSLRMDSFNKPNSKNTCIIVDEAHHSSSTSWYSFIMSIQPDCLLGFSGSVFEHEEDENEYLSLYQDCIIKSLFGRVIIDIDQVYLRKIGLLAMPIVYMKKIGNPRIMGVTGSYNVAYNSNIVENNQRNNIITKYVEYMISVNLSVLILVQRHDHGLRLLKAINREDVVCVFGGMSGHRIEYGSVVDFRVDGQSLSSNVKSGAIKVIIASQVFDEGVDIPAIGAVIMAGGGKVKRRNIQRIGRGVRCKIGEPNRVFILDFHDNTHVYMRSHSSKRSKVYTHAKIQATVVESEEIFKIIMSKQKKIKI